MTSTVDEGIAPTTSSSRRRLVVWISVLALVLAGCGAWLWQRGGFGHVVALDLTASTDCAYDPASGAVTMTVHLRGASDGSVRVGAHVEAHERASDGSAGPSLGATTVTDVVDGAFDEQLPVRIDVEQGRATGSVICLMSVA